ncbi:MAG: FprA family A-type flavoprotein [Ignavibacteriales bacterium]
MQAVKLADNIYWVGAIDWDLRDFHGYTTQRGSTYNAYLVIDEKITLIDTVKYYLVDEMLQRISSVIDPSKIDYIISNHVEMDHSGGLPRIMEIAKDAVIYTSPNGEKGLKAHYKKDWNFKVVKTGDAISLGKRTIDFVLTPMVHWPDNMVSWMKEENILFSNDAFGQHIAAHERFDDEIPFDIVIEEARKYYANIVLPYSMQVQKALEAVATLDIGMIAPSHGMIWRSHISDIIAEYKKWSSNESEQKALVIYDTMWESTKKIAFAIHDAFEEKGISVKMLNLRTNHSSDIMTDLITAKYICVGSPTLNSGMLPSVAYFMTYMKGLAPKNRKGLAFGSYGWGGQSIEQIEEILKACEFEIMEKLKIQYVPDKAMLDEVKERLRNSI